MFNERYLRTLCERRNAAFTERCITTFCERCIATFTERSPRTFYKRPQRTFVYNVIRTFYVCTALVGPYTTFCICKLLRVTERQQQNCDALSKISGDIGCFVTKIL